MKDRIFSLVAAMMWLPLWVAAQNPISPTGVYIADPTARVWQDGKLYIYGSTDSVPGSYCSKTYHVLSTDNLRQWTLHRESFWWQETLYAPDAICKDGRYYLYYDTPNGEEYVAESVSATGPFGNGVKIEGPKQIDPNVFIDDDGQAYYFWGQFAAKGARMNADMKTLDWTSMKDSIVTEKEHGFHEGSFVMKRGKYYYFIYADISRKGRPTSLGYAMSTQPMGPYEYKGIIIDNAGCDPKTWNNHGSIVEYDGQWYVLYHRSTHASSAMRKACIERIRFNEDGTIDEVEMTTQGAAPPLDARMKVDAARACMMEGNVRIRLMEGAADREELGEIHSGDKAAWKYLDFGKEGLDRVHIRLKSMAGGTVIVRMDSPDGPEMGRVSVPAGKDWQEYETECVPTKGVHAVWMEFAGGTTGNTLFGMDGFRFSKSRQRTWVSAMRTNGQESPWGTDPNVSPTFSWILASGRPGTLQEAYRIVVSCGGKKVWDSGKVKSDRCVAVPYEGALKPNTEYIWTLQVWDNHGGVTEESASKWQTGIRTRDWKAQWITASDSILPAYFRKTESISKEIRKATLYVTSHGIYEAYVNGVRVGNDELTPGWTSYNKRLPYRAYDVTDMLQKGKNMLAAVVSPGWYSGGMNSGNPKHRYKFGNDVALLLQVNLEYADGSKGYIMTDGGWECCVPGEDEGAKAGGMVFANIYDGVTIDARRVDASWNSVSPQHRWHKKAKVADMPKDQLVATVNEPVKAGQPVRAKAWFVTPKGEKVIDFGQNMVGWERVKLSGKKGDEIRITHAEVLDKEGNFYTENMRAAKTASTFILNGDGVETFEPRHTFYGFRYIRIEGLEGELRLEDFEAVPVCSGFDRIGEFSSSNPVINQLQHNIEWGFWGNFVDVPTDCPQRDERLGWTGDAQVFFRTASFLGRVDNFFNKWLADLKADQRADGRVPRIIPDTYPDGDYRTAATGWADAATIIPWNHYMAYGDVRILEQQYGSMKGWVDYMVSQSKDRGWLWNNGSHYGDWLFYSLSNDPGGQSAVTSSHLVAQCFFANSADIVSRTAVLLDKPEEADHYAEIARKVRKAYMDEYVTPNGLISSDTQTAYVLALQCNMLPESLRAQAVERLVENIKRYGNHITTGFLGTSYICNVLTEYGRSDMAYKLLLQETCPSWIYSVKKGATTIWERWNSILPDGSIMEGMNSFNHYSYGAIGDWLYRSAVGIRESAPGYKQIVVRPHPGGGFTHMQASTQTPYGKVAARWTAEEDVLKTLEVEIPVNTRAEVFVPASSVEAVTNSSGLTPDGISQGYVRFVVGSGKYVFEVE